MTSRKRDAAATVTTRFGLVPAGSVQSCLQDLAEAHAAQPVAYCILLSFTEEVFQAKLCRVHAKLFGDDVRVRIDSERSRHRPWTAVVTSRHSVCVDLKELE